MEFIDEQLLEYCEEQSSEESDVLNQLNRATHLKVLKSRMLSGHLQGKFLEIISQVYQPKCALEIGTFTGYSAICIAKGLQKGGKLFSLDNNEELMPMAEEFIEKAGFTDKVECVLGDALSSIKRLKDQKWDFVFIDADKKEYLQYYHAVIDDMVSGGVIIVDNVLWSGKVIQELKSNDLATKALLEFNSFIQKDDRVENVIIPLRDGLNIIRKK
jgi:predicted O-methyltransferase YrrM